MVVRPMTLEEFQDRFSNIADGYKYEFVKGTIIKTERSINAKQIFIAKNLFRRFTQTASYATGDELFLEVDQLTGIEQLRRPDISYWSASRIKNAAQTVSPFIIEIISPTDKSEEMDRKIKEYFTAGVQVVWQIFPNLKMVKVYRSSKDVQICEGLDVCSAKPVVPDFELTVEEIFAR